MNKRNISLLAGSLLPAVLLAKGDGDKPNIVLLMVDQMRFDYVGTVNPNVLTPALDAIASDGYLFCNGYSSTPSSTPARASLLTGFAPWRHGLLGYSGKIAEHYKYEMPAMLDSAGYYTIGVGKMHWTPQRNPHGFDELYLDESGRVESPGFVSDYRQWFARQAPGQNPDSTGLGWNDHAARPYALDESLHPTQWTGDRAIECIGAYDGTGPLFMKISFARPHSPYDPPARVLDMYEGRTMQEPAVGDWCAEFAPPQERPDAPFGDYGMEHALNSRLHYAASVTFIDEQIGRIVEALKAKGMYDNTLILFISDHGDMLGDHYHWRKTYPYEGSAHVPFIMKPLSGDRQRVRKGSVLSEVVEIRDVLPTFLDAAGAPVPEDMDGSSLLTLVRDRHAVWRDCIDLEHYSCYRSRSSWAALCSGNEKYIWNYNRGTEQLFDLEHDPYELKNLADDPRYAGRLEYWRGRMAEHLKERGENYVENGKLKVYEENSLFSPNFPPTK